MARTMQTEPLIGILIVIAAFAFIAWRYSVQRRRDREPSVGRRRRQRLRL